MTSFRFFLHASLAGLLSYSAAQAQLSINANPTNLLDKRFAAATTTVANGNVTAITVINGGSGYTLAPGVTVSAPASGNTATATATVSGGFLTAITINSGGSGYTTAPTISIAPPPAYNPSGTPAVTTSQYAGQANSSAGSGPINANELGKAIPGFAAGRYPRGYDRTNATPVTTVVLGRSSFGYSFATGSADISGQHYGTLNSVAKVLNKYDKTGIDIGGHTDNVGDSNYNYRLSQSRAASVANYLMGRSVNSGRFHMRGYGMDQPVASNNSASGRQSNRRVTIQLAPIS